MCISSIWHFYPRSPFMPKTASIIAAGGLLGVIASVVYALVRRAFFAGAEDPDLVERRFNLPIFGAIAFSAGQARLPSAKTRGNGASERDCFAGFTQRHAAVAFNDASVRYIDRRASRTYPCIKTMYENCTLWTLTGARFESYELAF